MSTIAILTAPYNHTLTCNPTNQFAATFHVNSMQNVSDGNDVHEVSQQIPGNPLVMNNACTR